MAGALGQVDRPLALDARAATPTRRPGAGDGPQHRVLAEPTDDRHPKGLRRLQQLIAADDLAAPSLGRLRLELGLADILGGWVGVRPAFLVIDALDAARSDGPLKAFRDLIREVVRAGGRWKVVASIREFDLRSSGDLQDLFVGAPIEGFSNPAFAGVRHLAVPRLDDDELGQVAAQAPGLAALASHVDGPSRELQRVPFNLRLLGDLWRGGALDGDLAPAWTQIELLDRYWARRVVGEDRRGEARESVLRAISEAMFAARGMWADRGAVAGDVAACEALRALLAGGILVDRAADRSVSYSHHVLYDYAAERLLLRGGGLVRRLESAPDACVAIRPSLAMHFQRLWALETSRRTFWDAVERVHRSPNVPATARTAGPAVAAASLRIPSDVDRIVARLESSDEDRRPAVEVLAYMVRALLATPGGPRDGTVGSDAGPWCEVLERLSRSMRRDLGPVVAPLLVRLSERADGMTPAQRSLAGAASRRILAFAWAEESPSPGLALPALRGPNKVPLYAQVCEAYQGTSEG